MIIAKLLSKTPIDRIFSTDNILPLSHFQLLSVVRTSLNFAIKYLEDSSSTISSEKIFLSFSLIFSARHMGEYTVLYHVKTYILSKLRKDDKDWIKAWAHCNIDYR